MAGAKNHDYHILPPDIWPLIGAFALFAFTSGMVLYMHEMPNHWLVLGLGVALNRGGRAGLEGPLPLPLFRLP